MPTPTAAAAAAASLALAHAATAEIVTYTFTGRVTVPNGFTDFADIELDDPFTMVFSIDTAVEPTTDTPTKRRWDGLELFTRYDITFNDTLYDFLDPAQFPNDASMTVEDDDIVEAPGRNDFFGGLVSGLDDFGFLSFSFQVEDFSGGSLPNITGTDLPTPAELEPDTYDRARISVIQPNGGVIRADIETITRVPAPATTIAAAPLVLARRRRR